MTADTLRRVGLWIAIALAACAALLFAAIALGQSDQSMRGGAGPVGAHTPDAAGSTPAPATAALAACVVGEAGWVSAVDHAAVLHVLDRRARASGRTLLAQALAYAAGCNAPRVALERPRQAEQWQAVLARVAAFERGELRDPCRGRAMHWGGTVPGTERDQARIAACVAAGTCEIVDCGPTRNTFFRGARP